MYMYIQHIYGLHIRKTECKYMLVPPYFNIHVRDIVHVCNMVIWFAISCLFTPCVFAWW